MIILVVGTSESDPFLASHQEVYHTIPLLLIELFASFSIASHTIV